MRHTWKNAIPKEIPAIIPRLFSIVVLTSAKQPFTTKLKHNRIKQKVILNQNLLQIQLTIFEMNCLFQTHRCVHHILSLGKILQCFWWALIAVFTAADRDAFLFEVPCICPVCVIIHPAAVQLKAKSHNKKNENKAMWWIHPLRRHLQWWEQHGSRRVLLCAQCWVDL